MSKNSGNRGGSDAIKARKFYPPDPIPSAMFEQVQATPAAAGQVASTQNLTQTATTQASQTPQAANTATNQSTPGQAKSD